MKDIYLIINDLFQKNNEYLANLKQQQIIDAYLSTDDNNDLDIDLDDANIPHNILVEEGIEEDEDDEGDDGDVSDVL